MRHGLDSKKTSNFQIRDVNRVQAKTNGACTDSPRHSFHERAPTDKARVDHARSYMRSEPDEMSKVREWYSFCTFVSPTSKYSRF